MKKADKKVAESLLNLYEDYNKFMSERYREKLKLYHSAREQVDKELSKIDRARGTDLMNSSVRYSVPLYPERSRPTIEGFMAYLRSEG